VKNDTEIASETLYTVSTTDKRQCVRGILSSNTVLPVTFNRCESLLKGRIWRENSMLRRIFEPKWEDVEMGKIHFNFYSLRQSEQGK
jgi:hypothetical protein